MKYLTIILFLLSAGSLLAQAPTISPINPQVYQGKTINFSCTSNCGGGSWSCTSCAGSINSGTGVYTAPGTITAKQTEAGYQLLPNNHILNTRIDSLSVNSSNSTWVGLSREYGSYVNYLASYPVNFVNSSTPTTNMLFYYTPTNNAAFKLPNPARTEAGWYSALANDNADHHIFTIDYTNGNIGEIYQFYTPGANVSCPTCNSQSGDQYTAHDYALLSASTGASGIMEQPTLLRVQEMKQALASGGTINHALKITFQGSPACQTFIWPATTNSTGFGIPCGARARLQSSYSLAGLSAIATILVTQLQQYGVIFMDGGGWWQITPEYAQWPKAYADAFAEVAAAHKTFSVTNTAITSNVATVTATNDLTAGSTSVLISGTTNCGGALNFPYTPQIVTAANGSSFSFALTHADCTSASDSGTVNSPLKNYMEFVDESGLEISSSSGETNLNRETVTYTTGGGSASTDVILTGVAVNLPQDVLYIMAGTPAQQLTAFINDGNANTVTWSMSPTVGTLTAGGLYTAPASQASPTSTTVTATSTVNSAIYASMTLWVFPQTGIRVLPASTSDYTDSFSKVWTSGIAFGTSNVPGVTGCCNFNGSFPHITDYQLWSNNLSSSLVTGDMYTDFLVPRGNYAITFNEGVVVAANQRKLTFISQGAVLASNVDPSAVAGGVNLPYTFTTYQYVGSNNSLSFHIFGAGGVPVRGADISSLSVVSTTLPSGSSISGVTINGGVTIQ